MGFWLTSNFTDGSLLLFTRPNWISPGGKRRYCCALQAHTHTHTDALLHSVIKMVVHFCPVSPMSAMGQEHSTDNPDNSEDHLGATHFWSGEWKELHFISFRMLSKKLWIRMDNSVKNWKENNFSKMWKIWKMSDFADHPINKNTVYHEHASTLKGMFSIYPNLYTQIFPCILLLYVSFWDVLGMSTLTLPEIYYESWIHKAI